MQTMRRKVKKDHPWRNPWSKKSQSDKDIEAWKHEGIKLKHKPINRDKWRSDGKSE